MAKKEYKCPHCNSLNKLILMGGGNGTFGKICSTCNSEIEIVIENKDINVLLPKEEKNKNDLVQNTKIPIDYKKYKPDGTNQKIAKFIAFLILTSSLMGLFTGIKSIYYFDKDYNDSENIKIEIIIKNNSANIENAEIILNGEKLNSTYLGNGTYIIMAKPGKHLIEVSAPLHKNSTMDLFIPPQENNLEWNGRGLDGVNRFNFDMQEGEGNTTLKSLFSSIGTWCPNLGLLFSIIGIWGAWITYTLQSYKNAQIGAFFSVLGMGFFIIGPILSVIALYYLKKHKNMFTASFKN